MLSLIVQVKVEYEYQALHIVCAVDTSFILILMARSGAVDIPSKCPAETRTSWASTSRILLPIVLSHGT